MAEIREVDSVKFDTLFLENYNENLTYAIVLGLNRVIELEVLGCGNDRNKLRKLFESVWETRNHGFCCDHIVTEDGNTDDSCVEFCIDSAISNKHFDCLTMLLMLRNIEDEELRDQVVSNETDDPQSY